MINPFKIKEIAGLIIPQFFMSIGMLIILPMYGMLIASLSAFLLMVLGYVIGKLILRNPFNDMLKGEGILTIPLDSKGLITPFLCKFRKGYLEGTFKGEAVKSPFDRKMVFNITAPDKTEVVKDSEGNYYIKVSNDDFNSSRMALYHFPTLLYNSQMGSFITKDWLSEKETETFSRHHIIHANKIAERLTEQITNFGRYIADHALNRVNNILSNPTVRTLITIFIIGLVAFLLFKFAPQIFHTATSTINKATGATP